MSTHNNSSTQTVSPVGPSPKELAKMKRLDLSQITNHPLVQNRSSPEVVVPGELRSRTNSQVVQERAQVINSNIEREKKVLDQQKLQQPAKVMKELQAASIKHQVPVILTPKRAVSEFLPRVSNLETIEQSPVKSQAATTNDSNNNNNNNISEDQKKDNQSNFLRIRRSTSLSYTSTLRKRRNEANGAGLYNSELPSPRPNVKLSNFSISPYNSSNATLPRRLSLKEQD